MFETGRLDPDHAQSKSALTDKESNVRKICGG